MTTLITKLRTTNSVVEKQLYLVNYANEDDKKIFQFAYDPYKTYGVRFDNIDMDNIGEPDAEMYNILNKLASRELSGDLARRTVINYANVYGELIKLICNKDLDCGVTATTLNSTFGKDFINKFAIQLAKEEDLDKLSFPMWGQLKYNGARVVTRIEDGIITFKSRGGHEFGYPELREQIMRHYEVYGLNTVLDGELTYGDSQNSDHTAVSGLVNSAIKGSPIADNLGLKYHVFDAMRIEDFDKQKCAEPYHARLALVRTTVNAMFSEQVKPAETYIFNSREDLDSKYAELIATGYEGLILKQSNGYYTFKKNKTWIKMKAIETVELTCVGFNFGEGKYEGMIGALNCEGFIGDKAIRVDVGSGLTDEDRARNPNDFIGKEIEIKYNTVIQDSKTGNWSLFLPRYVMIREGQVVMANPLQPKVVKCLEEEYDAFVINVTAASRAGIMDIIACIKGKFYGFEVKWKNDVPSELQKQKINNLLEAGGKAWFIRSVEQLRQVIDNDLEPIRYVSKSRRVL